LKQSLRRKFDPLGCFEADGGGFATGHTPAVAPQAYLCRFYGGLSEEGVDDAEAESERFLPQPYRDFLGFHNGAQILGISLYGATGGRNLRATSGMGQPISIRYQNVFYTRPEYIPEGHFGLGSMNGRWYSQGHFYLTSAGEVELINREHDVTATRWPSFEEFLTQEVHRQMSRYDDAGNEIAEIEPLPGNVTNWEALGKESSDRRKRENSPISKALKGLNVFRRSR